MMKGIFSAIVCMTVAIFSLTAHADEGATDAPQDAPTTVESEAPVLSEAAAYFAQHDVSDDDSASAEDLGPLYLDESLQLRRKSLRQGISAGAVYLGSAALLGFGIQAVTVKSCPANGSCPNNDLSVRQVAGIVSISVASAAALSIGLPLHRSANYHRRSAHALASGDIQDFSMRGYHGAKLARTGRNYLIGGASMAVVALSTGIAAAVVDDDEHRNSLVSAASPAILSAVVLGAVGTGLHFGGKRLTRRGNAAPAAQALVAPAFYGDGAGLSLYMGF